MKLISALLIAVLVSFSSETVCAYLFKNSARHKLWQDGPKDKKDNKKGNKKKEKKKPGDKKENTKPAASDSKITALQTWTMPTELTEISGMVFIDDHKLACIQDESGIIYTYNLVTKKIESRLTFAAAGDFEDIAYGDGKYFVLRADGAIYEVSPAEGSKPFIHNTGFTIEQDCEGMVFSKQSGQLLIVLKGKDPLSTKKGVYAYDFKSRKLIENPVSTINLEDKGLVDLKKKSDAVQSRFEPSSIAIDPKTNDFYITNGGKASLMVLSVNSEIKIVTPLDRSVFPQAEGVAFSNTGELYISSEGVKGEGVIVKCKLNN
jgi:uncharacterized protein YjiK